MTKIAAVVLAAGKGTRMACPQRSERSDGRRGNDAGSDIPKVMFEVNGKPIIRYGIDHVKEAGVKKITLVVGYKQEILQDYLGSEVEYVIQGELLGTGHAVMVAKEALRDKAEAVMVCYGDHVMYKPNTIKRLIELYEQEKPAIAMLTVRFKDPVHWAFGRIIRNEKGELEKIVEQKDCTSEQLKIGESNPGFYIFEAQWLWANIGKLKQENAQKEYYLTDMVGMAREQKKKIATMEIDNEDEARGINTLEHLREVERALSA